MIVSRNGAATLGALLDDLAANRIGVTLVDHGSTDATWALGQAAMRRPVEALLREPYRGAFDLTRQLELRAELIRTARADWILNLDDDEFLEPGEPGETLRDLIERMDAAGETVIEAREFVFVPGDGRARHEPARFRETMRHYAPVRTRNPKQRAFRAGRDLTLWRKTGGHLLTRDAAEIAGERLVMRHYPGLSLDALRAKYLGRVFAAGDLAKGWHDTRIGGEADFIRAPDPAGLRVADGGRLCFDGATEALPFVFAPDPPPPAPLGAAELIVAAPPGCGAELVAAALGQAFPGLAVVPVCEGFGAVFDADCPLLVVERDPRSVAVLTEAPDPAAAVAGWLRRTCYLRQIALSRAGAERVSWEALPGGFGPVLERLGRRLGRSPVMVPPPMLGDEAPARRRWQALAAARGLDVIAAPVLAEFGGAAR